MRIKMMIVIIDHDVDDNDADGKDAGGEVIITVMMSQRRGSKLTTRLTHRMTQNSSQGGEPKG